MDSWSVLVWNMALGSPWPHPRDPELSWSRLRRFMKQESAQIALLNEAKVPHGTHAIYEESGTKGRDFKPRPWSTAVVSDWPSERVTDARPRNYLGHERTRLPFQTSRPGSWTVATVEVPETGNVTCISIYGLLDDLSDASVHRSLSEVSPVFSDPRFKGRVVLGGDLNLTTQWPEKDGLLARARGVLERIEAYGLIDCLAEKRGEQRLVGCACSLEPCTHTRTKWTLASPDGGYPHQMDYVFASKRLVEDGGLLRCYALTPKEWKDLSDHAPLVAEFRTG